MDAKTQARFLSEEEIRLKELIVYLGLRKWAVLAVTFGFAFVAGIAAWVSTPMYKASIIVAPATSTPGNGPLGSVSSLAPELGGLASLAGLTLGTDSRKAQYVAVLESDALTERYIEENHLLPVLYAPLWDARTGRWKVDDPRKIPTPWKALQRFKRRIRTITTDHSTGLVTLTITWRDPRVAAAWANGLVKMANDYLRAKAIAESERNIAYLNDQAARTDVVGVKQAVYALMQNEINKAMLARGTDEYALKVIDPALAPEAPSSPQQLLWVLLGAFGGLTVALFAAFLRLAWLKG